jgi:Flp pilus assembly protein TadG
VHRWSRSTERPSSGRRDDDAGSAALEFLLVGLVLLVPIVYLIVALGLIQERMLGAETAARYVARVLATTDGSGDARERVEHVLRDVADEYGLDRRTVELDMACLPHADPCPDAGSVVTVTVVAHVVLPLAPPILGLDRAAAIDVEGRSSQRVSRTWGSR